MLNTIDEAREECLRSLLHFTKVFYELRTGREFRISQPVGRESHYIQICRELTKVFRGETVLLNINIPPRYGKTELLIHFVAWAMAHYPDCNFIYTCYSHTLATKATQTIREIIQLPYYRRLFGVELSDASQAKDNFATTKGGTVYACGTGGTITGHGAGVKGVKDRFTGAFIIDDSIKPDEATSDTVREGITNWYYNTAQSRMNNGNLTPQINIGQRTHEVDLTAHLMQNGWHSLILPALDVHNNALDDAMYTTEDLLAMKEKEPYVFAAQYQQDPQPSGGGIFKEEWFPLLDAEPNIVATFITADTAETSKTYNDPSVFSFWGLYKIMNFGQDSGIYGLHWIDCLQIWVEPKDLRAEFLQFYTDCMRFKVQPKMAAIEKKSTGSTLLSVLSDFQGMQIIDIERTKASGRKADRFLKMQPYISSKRISLPRNGRHTKMVLEHMRKITANDSHRYDDICDTAYDAVNLALIHKLVTSIFNTETKQQQSVAIQQIADYHQRLQRNRRAALWS